ncbi:MAG: GNAT family N-acetyltransferase [Gammaproteobacteria bacterium]|nr:GNAT family N-acetyltransferase [Gammaproteobacteria bacterium]
MLLRARPLISDQLWGFWAVETKSENEFIGFVGLHKPTYDLPVTPCVEIGWRVCNKYWGKGYATEAAQESLRFAFEELKLSEVYSFTSVSNTRSWSVMERLKMENTKNNFEHPIIPEGHPLREHVLYKITSGQWGKNTV